MWFRKQLDCPDMLTDHIGKAVWVSASGWKAEADVELAQCFFIHLKDDPVLF